MIHWLDIASRVGAAAVLSGASIAHLQVFPGRRLLPTRFDGADFCQTHR